MSTGSLPRTLASFLSGLMRRLFLVSWQLLALMYSQSFLMTSGRESSDAPTMACRSGERGGALFGCGFFCFCWLFFASLFVPFFCTPFAWLFDVGGFGMVGVFGGKIIEIIYDDVAIGEVCTREKYFTKAGPALGHVAIASDSGAVRHIFCGELSFFGEC